MAKFNVPQASFNKGYSSLRMRGQTGVEDYFASADRLTNFLVLPQGGLKKRNGTLDMSQLLPPKRAVGSRLLSVFDSKKDVLFAIDYREFEPGDDPYTFHEATITCLTVKESVTPPTTIEENGLMQILFSTAGYGEVVGAIEAFDTLIKTCAAECYDNLFSYPYLTDLRACAKGNFIVLYDAQARCMPVILRYKEHNIVGRDENDKELYNRRLEVYSWEQPISGEVDSEFRRPYKVYSSGKDISVTKEVIDAKDPQNPGDKHTIVTLKLPERRGGSFKDIIKDTRVRLDVIYTQDNKDYKLHYFGRTTTIADDGKTLKFVIRHNATPELPASVSGKDGVVFYVDEWAEGFPKVFTAFQQRLVAANAPNAEDTFWGSHSQSSFLFMGQQLPGDAEKKTSSLAMAYNFWGGVKATDPYEFNIASGANTPINWMVGGNVLYIGKNDGEYIATGYEASLSPLAVSITRRSSEGGYNIPCPAIEEGAFFISKNGKEINFVLFNERNGTTSSLGSSSSAYGFLDDLTIFRKDSGSVNRLSRQNNYHINQVEYLTSSGLLITNTDNRTVGSVVLRYNASSRTFAMLELRLGKSESEIEPPNIISMATSLSGEGIYLLIDRTFGVGREGRVRTLEYFEENPDYCAPLGDVKTSEEVRKVAHYCDLVEGGFIPYDCCRTLRAKLAPHDYWTSVKDLLPNTIYHVLDVQGEQVIESNDKGFADLKRPIVGGYVGLPYTAELSTLPISYGSEGQDLVQGKPRKVDKITLSLYNARGGRVITKRSYPIKYPKPKEFFTGDVVNQVDMNFSKSASLKIIHDDPYPFILLAVTFNGVGYVQ